MSEKFCPLRLMSSSLFLAWFTLHHVCPKHQLTFSGLPSNISQKTELFVTAAVRTSVFRFVLHCAVIQNHCYQGMWNNKLRIKMTTKSRNS
jgi:hypothetical protein